MSILQVETLRSREQQWGAIAILQHTLKTLRVAPTVPAAPVVWDLG